MLLYVSFGNNNTSAYRERDKHFEHAYTSAYQSVTPIFWIVSIYKIAGLLLGEMLKMIGSWWGSTPYVQYVCG